MINLLRQKSKAEIAGKYLLVTYVQEVHPKKKVFHWEPLREREIEIHDQSELEAVTARITRESDENYRKAVIANFDTYETTILMKKTI